MFPPVLGQSGNVDAMEFTPNLGAWQVVTPKGKSNSAPRGNGQPYGLDIYVTEPKIQKNKRFK